MIERYLKLAIHYDYPFNITKYCLQQLLGSEQESEHGKAFLACATLGEFKVFIAKFVWLSGDLAAWGGLGNEWEERQRELTALGEAMMVMSMMMMVMMTN